MSTFKDYSRWPFIQGSKFVLLLSDKRCSVIESGKTTSFIYITSIYLSDMYMAYAVFQKDCFSFQPVLDGCHYKST